MSESLAAHSKYRAPLGIPDLKWSSSLAQRAQAWADHLASSGSFSHSHTDNVGENIAYGSANSHDAGGFVDMWAEEEEYFVAGRNYPECSSSGDQADVWHYTQMIWEKTTELGCGMGRGSGKLYYVCQYSPPGNRRGDPVYTTSGNSVQPASQQAPEESFNLNPDSEVQQQPQGQYPQQQQQQPQGQYPQQPQAQYPQQQQQPQEQYPPPQQQQQPELSPSSLESTTGTQSSLMTESLAAHHQWRSAVGVPDLVWNASLASNAQAWADTIASNGRSSHSKNRVNTGENIAYGTASSNSITDFVGLWGAEGEYFVSGRPYPECSSGGESDVWHYTQLVWRKSTQLGCGMGSSNGKNFYVCQYYPRGNMLGQTVY
jgi:uncharacterized protein YkwD